MKAIPNLGAYGYVPVALPQSTKSNSITYLIAGLLFIGILSMIVVWFLNQQKSKTPNLNPENSQKKVTDNSPNSVKPNTMGINRYWLTPDGQKVSYEEYVKSQQNRFGNNSI